MTRLNQGLKESARCSRHIVLLIGWEISCCCEISFRAQYFEAHDHFVSSDRLKKIVPPCGWLLTHLRKLPYCFIRDALLDDEISFSRKQSGTVHYDWMKWTSRDIPLRRRVGCDGRKTDSKCIDINILQRKIRWKICHFFNLLFYSRQVMILLY